MDCFPSGSRLSFTDPGPQTLYGSVLDGVGVLKAQVHEVGDLFKAKPLVKVKSHEEFLFGGETLNPSLHHSQFLFFLHLSGYLFAIRRHLTVQVIDTASPISPRKGIHALYPQVVQYGSNGDEPDPCRQRTAVCPSVLSELSAPLLQQLEKDRPVKVFQILPGVWNTFQDKGLPDGMVDQIRESIDERLQRLPFPGSASGRKLKIFFSR